MSGFTANFGKGKGGLSTVRYTFLDKNHTDIILPWPSVDGELEPDTGIYFVNAVAPANAFWIMFGTGETPFPSTEVFLLLGVQEKAFVFDFGESYSGRNVSYQYFTDLNNPTGAVITAVTEWEEADEKTGIYLPDPDVIIPTNAVFVKAWTDDVPPVYVAGAIDFDVTVYTQVPRTGPIQEEIEL
jgi:hypothetical protein